MHPLSDRGGQVWWHYCVCCMATQLTTRPFCHCYPAVPPNTHVHVHVCAVFSCPTNGICVVGQFFSCFWPVFSETTLEITWNLSGGVGGFLFTLDNLWSMIGWDWIFKRNVTLLFFFLSLHNTLHCFYISLFLSLSLSLSLSLNALLILAALLHGVGKGMFSCNTSLCRSSW